MKKLLLPLLAILLTTTCKKSETNPPNLPNPPSPVIATITTTVASAITSTTATSGGNVTSDGGATITERGICFNTSTNPTTSNNKVASGSGTGSFTSNMSVLKGGTIYYVRAYAINSAGTAYGNEVNFFTPYQEVMIGTQVWMLKNLEVTTYRNGDPIPQVNSPIQWTNLTTGAWCYYFNNPAMGDIYGRLYNWYAVNDPRSLAPAGWHVPSDAEWTTLVTYLGGYLVAGGKMKTTGTIQAGTSLWYEPNTGATNSSGFTGLPGGAQANNGLFLGFSANLSSFYGFWWSSTEYTDSSAHSQHLFYNDERISRSQDRKLYGNSIRCVKD